MFKKPTKRQFIIRRIILSTIATVSVLIIATASVLYMLGYRLDGGNNLEQGALLQFDSTPADAEIYVDGDGIGARTGAKHTVVSGVHTVSYAKNGYHDWTRTLNLPAGTITWLDYARLVPTELPVKTVTTHDSLVSMEISPDNRWALLHEEADSPTFMLADLRSETVETSSLTITSSAITQPEDKDGKRSITPITWDSGSRYVLIKHLYDGQTEWIVLDTQDTSRATNISRLLGEGFKDIQFAGTSGEIFYGLTDEGTIRKVDLAAETLSRALVTHVDSFSVFDNTIVSYVGDDPNDATQRVAGVYRDGDESAHILHRAANSKDAEVVLRIAVGRYYDDTYVAIAEGNVVTVLRGDYPSSSAQDNSSLPVYELFELSGTVTALSISEEGDYILAQSGEQFKSYEVEHKRVSIGTIATKQGVAASTLKWLDEAVLWNDDDGTLQMRDFNGDNLHSIMKAQTGFDASVSQNGRYFYAVGKDDAGFHLQRVTMILN